MITQITSNKGISLNILSFDIGEKVTSGNSLTSPSFGTLTLWTILGQSHPTLGMVFTPHELNESGEALLEEAF